MDELDAKYDQSLTFRIVRRDDATTIITLGGELDMSSADKLRTEMAATVARRPRRLIVDVGDVRFADSSAIALWVQWAATVDHFELRDPPPLLRRVIAAMGLGVKLGLRG